MKGLKEKFFAEGLLKNQRLLKSQSAIFQGKNQH
jgi:hypothetical protein